MFRKFGDNQKIKVVELDDVSSDVDEKVVKKSLKKAKEQIVVNNSKETKKAK